MHHDLVVKAGKVHEAHLCERCAADAGAAQHPEMLLAEWLGTPATPGGGAAGAQGAAGRASPAACPGCGMTFTQLKKTGLVGCASCYETFEKKLTALLRRAHDGGSLHVGKVPPLPPADEAPSEVVERDTVALAERVASLRDELARAVEAEAYEKAARIRDALMELRASEDDAGVQAGGEGSVEGGDEGAGDGS